MRVQSSLLIALVALTSTTADAGFVNGLKKFGGYALAGAGVATGATAGYKTVNALTGGSHPNTVVMVPIPVQTGAANASNAENRPSSQEMNVIPEEDAPQPIV